MFLRKESIMTFSWTRSSVALLAATVLAIHCADHTGESFTVVPQTPIHGQVSAPTMKLSILFSSSSSGGDQDTGSSSDNDNDMDFSDFNPLSYSKKSKQRSAHSYTGTTIDLRQTVMRDVTNQLLNVVGNEEETNQILQQHQAFLLEPLEDPDAVLGEGSIYTPQMSRSDRYQAYRVSMEERLASCKSAQVHAVLTSMKGFVLGFETVA